MIAFFYDIINQPVWINLLGVLGLLLSGGAGISIYYFWIYRNTLERATEKSMLIEESLKSQFIANMSHDLRTPLAGIIGLADVTSHLLDEMDQQTIKENLHDIQISAQQLMKMIDDILQITTIESQQLSRAPLESFCVKQCLYEVATTMKPAISNKRLYCRFSIDPGLEKGVYGDSKLLHHVLLNLLSNAIKFTQRGGIQVSVERESSSKQKREKKRMLKLSITDSGSGIPIEQQKLIFDPFTRLESKEIGGYPSSGLGLYLIKTRIEKSGGSIEVSSEVGKGTTFCCHIPIEFAKPGEVILDTSPLSIDIEPTLPNVATKLSTQADISPLTDVETASHAESRQRYHILLVEDNPYAMRTALTWLQVLPCQVDCVSTQVEALDYAAKRHYDLILMDIGLPDGDGRQATQIIRLQSTINRETPIVALTAHITPSEHESCLVAGMSRVLYKPLNQEKINHLLNVYLDSSSIDTVDPSTETFDQEQPLAIIDMKQAVELMNGNEKSVKENLGKLVASLPAYQMRCEAAYQSHNWSLLQSQVHQLQGSVSYCGTPQLKSSCRKLEKFLSMHTDIDPQVLEPYYQTLQQAIHEVCVRYKRIND